MLKRNKFKKKIKFFKRKINLLFKKHKVIVFVFLFGLIFIFGIKIAYNHYIDNPKNLIKNVFFQKQILNNPDLTWLIAFTQNILSGQNTIKNKFLRYQEQIQLIKNKYPFIKQVEITTLSNNSVQVEFKFKNPLFKFIGSWNIFAVYNENKIYLFHKDYLSGINLTWANIFLPKYLLWRENLNNIFWKNSPQKILNYYKKIQQKLPKSTIIYLAGGEYFKVLHNNKVYFISLSKNLNLQLNQLDIIKLKLPDKFKNAKQIDLGSLKNWIFLK